MNLSIPPPVRKHLFIVPSRVTRSLDGEQTLHRIVQKNNLSLGVDTHDSYAHLQKEVRACEVTLHGNKRLVIYLGQPIDFVVSPLLVSLCARRAGYSRHLPDHAFE